MLSVFDIYKVGVGPSSSHTVGPMKAGAQFIEELQEKGILNSVTRIIADVYGSLSLTGKGHLTDSAIILGLAGNKPETVDIDAIPAFLEEVLKTERLPLGLGGPVVVFDRMGGIRFNSENLPLHENGMVLRAFSGEEEIYRNTYYSVGGGFILDAAHFSEGKLEQADFEVPHPFTSGSELVERCKTSGLSISSLVLQNELVRRTHDEIEHMASSMWDVMQDTMERGMRTEGVLPGVLKVTRRAAPLMRLLTASAPFSNDPMKIIDWVNLFAIAVSEENATGGRVVTAPTNGACGVVPAILMYYHRFVMPLTPEILVRFFMASGAIGILYKRNASISGAEVGCQGEVGVACSMAAGGLAELMGGNAEQVSWAAEIAMEHSLGLTCDPIAGLVQIPCIERNAVGAVKAINATRMAMRRTSAPRISLDEVIATMYMTGKDMSPAYRETSMGGLAKAVHC